MIKHQQYTGESQIKQSIKVIGLERSCNVSAIKSTSQYFVEGLYELEHEPNLNETIMGVPVVGGWGDVETQETCQ